MRGDGDLLLGPVTRAVRRQREGGGQRGRGREGRGGRVGWGGVRRPRGGREGEARPEGRPQGGREGEPSRALRGGRGAAAGAARFLQPLRGSSAGRGARVPREVSLGCSRAAPPGGVAVLVIFLAATSFESKGLQNRTLYLMSWVRCYRSNLWSLRWM